VREKAYAVSGWVEAVPRGRVGQVRSDELAAWVARHYPRRRYPAVFVGSSNGATVHLAAALGAPWLPRRCCCRSDAGACTQTTSRATCERVWNPARALLRTNPDLALHHMHDPNQDRPNQDRPNQDRPNQDRPNQDRLMIAGMTYFG
jgi:hypothetical protein